MDRAALILDAQRKGFGVHDSDGWWWIDLPARPRLPAHTQGAFTTSREAWSVAASIARDYPEPK